MKGKKTVQFDRSVDVQKDEMRRERAAKEAERIRQTIEDSRTNAVIRSANDPPHDFLHPGDHVAEKSFNSSLRACAPPSFSLPPPSPIGSRRPSIKSPLTPRFSGSGSLRPPSFGDSSGSQRWRTDSYKTALCHEWRDNQTCQYGEYCRYAHGVHELRPPIQANPHYKTVLCRHFTELGECPHGSKCKFVHRRDPHHSRFSSSAMPATSTPSLNLQSFGSSMTYYNPLLSSWNSSLSNLPFGNNTGQTEDNSKSLFGFHF